MFTTEPIIGFAFHKIFATNYCAPSAAKLSSMLNIDIFKLFYSLQANLLRIKGFKL